MACIAIETDLDAEIWAARIGDCALVGASREIFSEIGHAVRAASPAQVTLLAAYCNGLLGYVATPEEYPFGGYEPAVSHRGYGHPAPFSPDVGPGLLGSCGDRGGTRTSEHASSSGTKCPADPCRPSPPFQWVGARVWFSFAASCCGTTWC